MKFNRDKNQPSDLIGEFVLRVTSSLSYQASSPVDNDAGIITSSFLALWENTRKSISPSFEKTLKKA